MEKSKIYLVLTQSFYQTPDGIDHAAPVNPSNILLFDDKAKAKRQAKQISKAWLENFEYTLSPEDPKKLSKDAKSIYTILLNQQIGSSKWRTYIHVFENHIIDF